MKAVVCPACEHEFSPDHSRPRNPLPDFPGSYKHGLSRYLEGCTCEVCTSRYELAVRFYEARMRISDEMPADVARDVGVTRQYGHLLINDLYPDRPWEEADRMLKLEREAHRMNKLFKNCPTCGVGHFRPKFCSNRCQAVRNQILRIVVDKKTWYRHRKSIANWTLKHSDEVNDIQLRHAKRVVSGEASTREELGHKARWLQPGSRPWSWAIYATQEGWPIAEKFPEDIKKQVAEAISSSGSPMEEPSWG